MAVPLEIVGGAIHTLAGAVRRQGESGSRLFVDRCATMRNVDSD